MAYYSNKKQETTTTTRKPYNSRVYIMKSLNKDKDGNDRVDTVIISHENYWFLNRSKSGGLYGRITISGEYNEKRLNEYFGSVNTTERGTPITLFFYDKDAEYLDNSGHERLNKSFIARLYEKDGGLCAQVLKLF